MATNSKRIAAFDIGTVTCRLLLAEVQDGVLHELERRCVITNLGVGVDKTGVLQEDAIQRVVAQIGEYIEIVNSYRTEQQPEIPIVAVATSASRDAKNSDALVGKLHDLGVELSVIEGEREAALSFRGASRGYEGENLLVADIGGGSTEVVLGVGGEAPKLAHSFNVGCRRMTERFYVSDPPAELELAHMRKTRGLQSTVLLRWRARQQALFPWTRRWKCTILLWLMALRFQVKPWTACTASYPACPLQTANM